MNRDAGLHTHPCRERPKRRIDWLKAGDAIPVGEPRRQRHSCGYVVLRWNIAPHYDVCVFEHRLIAGLDAEHVHHKNGIKDDNRPENLERIAGAEHKRLHAPRKFDIEHARRLRGMGLSWKQVGDRLGVNGSSVIRRLQRYGTPMSRTVSEGKLLQYAMARREASL